MAQAQSNTNAAAPAGTNRDKDDFHLDNEIVVTAPFVENLNILAGTSALSGDDLARDVRGQIGDSLTRLPGVSATSFAPGASRPVLRGFQGPRVAVLTDGIGTLDASVTSADHGVSIDTLTTQRVEVLRGPAVLLFGGSAIGGAVNVIDKRIPRDIPDEAVHFDALGGFGSAADDAFIGASVDVPLSETIVFHADGSFRSSGDVSVGDFTLAPGLRAEAAASAEEEREEGNIAEAEEFEELANLRGTVPNSAAENTTAAAGIAYIGEGGQLGVSVSYFDNDYGVPARPGAEHAEEEGGVEEGEEEEGPVTIAQQQWRVDLRGAINLGGFFEKVTIRAGYADYEHTEFEGDEVGTLFLTEGIEARTEFVQSERNGWRGVIGGQYQQRDLSAIGAEAFIPPNELEAFALFTVQEIRLGDFEVEGAARYENASVRSDTVNFDRSFDAFSGALGLAYAPADSGVRLGINLSRAERAPAPEELLSNGPHIATQAFEIGDPSFITEKSWGGEIYARYESETVELSATLFVNAFDDFIFEAETGEEEDGLPVFQFFQADATYWGVELNGSAQLGSIGGFKLVTDGVLDFVRASIDNGGGPVPRIPPLRILGGIEAQSGALDLRAEVEWTADQDRVTSFETATDGFTLVNASLSWRPLGKDSGVTLLASANNIFDVDARRHASFTKDFVPLSGRDFRISARLSF